MTAFFSNERIGDGGNLGKLPTFLPTLPKCLWGKYNQKGGGMLAHGLGLVRSTNPCANIPIPPVFTPGFSCGKNLGNGWGTKNKIPPVTLLSNAPNFSNNSAPAGNR